MSRAAELARHSESRCRLRYRLISALRPFQLGQKYCTRRIEHPVAATDDVYDDPTVGEDRQSEPLPNSAGLRSSLAKFSVGITTFENRAVLPQLRQGRLLIVS